MDHEVSALIEAAVGQPVAEAEQAAWGFQNRTDLVTLAGGERVVLQRYRVSRPAHSIVLARIGSRGRFGI